MLMPLSIIITTVCFRQKGQKGSRDTGKGQVLMPYLYLKKDAKNVKKTKGVNNTMEVEHRTEVKQATGEEEATESNKSNLYSETKMSQEEMLKWRERKQHMECYTNSIFKCTKCIEPLESLIVSGAHEKRHTEIFGEIECHICGQRSLDDAALAAHLLKHYSLLKCSLCEHEWDDVNAMRRHCSEAHGVDVTSWNCDQCDREFPSPLKLSVHARCHRRRTCPECGKLLRTGLKKHMLSAHRELPLRRCPVCKMQCKGDSGLKAHMSIHPKQVDEATFCSECNIQFRNKYVYRSHMRNTVRHAAEKDLKFRCAACGKGFLQHFALVNHMDAVHDREEKYACEQCGQGFRTVVARRKHVRREHEGKLPPKDKICDYCGKAFKTRVLLMQHTNSHTGARPFKCHLCDATFGFRSARYLHLRFKHNVGQVAEVTQE